MISVKSLRRSTVIPVLLFLLAVVTYLNNITRNPESPIKLFSSKKYSIYSSNPEPQYLFYLPIIQLIWWHRYNISSLIVTVGDKTQWDSEPYLKVATKWALEWSKRTGSHLIHVQCSEIEQSSLSQVVRLFIPALAEISDNTFLITSDVDLVPLHAELFETHERPGFLTNANCCGSQTFLNHTSPHIPMCHVGTTAKLWRKMMAYPGDRKSWTRDSLSELTKQVIDPLFGNNSLHNSVHPNNGGNSKQWHIDQTYLSYRYSVSKDAIGSFFEEHFTIQPRIDRINWPILDAELLRYARDAHLPRYNLQEGEKAMELFRLILKEEIFLEILKYKKEFDDALDPKNE